jgi:hypothetical protein
MGGSECRISAVLNIAKRCVNIINSEDQLQRKFTADIGAQNSGLHHGPQGALVVRAADVARTAEEEKQTSESNNRYICIRTYFNTVIFC